MRRFRLERGSEDKASFSQAMEKDWKNVLHYDFV